MCYYPIGDGCSVIVTTDCEALLCVLQVVTLYILYIDDTPFESAGLVSTRSLFSLLLIIIVDIYYYCYISLFFLVLSNSNNGGAVNP